MSIPAINSGLNLQSPYQSSGSVADILENKADTSSINGITNMDSFVKSSLEAEKVNSTYTPATPSNPFDVSNLTGALKAISTPVDLGSITNVDEYASQVLTESQLSEASQLADMQSAAGNADSVQNLDDSVKMAFDEDKNNLSIPNTDFSAVTDMGSILDSV